MCGAGKAIVVSKCNTRADVTCTDCLLILVERLTADVVGLVDAEYDQYERAVHAEAEVEHLWAAIGSLFGAIEHGADEHRAWLQAAIDQHFEPLIGTSGDAG